MTEYVSGLTFIGNPVVVDANTASTRRALPLAPKLALSIPANGCWFKFGTIDVAAQAGVAGVVSTSTLTSTGVFSAGEKAIIGSTTYTFVAALSTPTAVPYEVLIGANQTASHLNLLRAINAGAGAGTLYGTGTIAHPTVIAISSDGTHTIINAKVQGTAGNAIGTTEGAAAAAMANASWTSTVMASGAAATEDSFYLPPNILFVIDNPLYTQTNAGYIAAIKNTTAALLYVQGCG